MQSIDYRPEFNDLPIRYIEGDRFAFVHFVKSNWDNMLNTVIDGHFRWILKEGDTLTIVRPMEAKV